MAYSVLIIGLGQIGMGYDIEIANKEIIYTHAKAFFYHQDFEIVGGVDPDENLRVLFERKFNKPSFFSTQEALHSVGVTPDIIVIAVPTRFHKSIFEEIVPLAKPKVILIEKPISFSLNEAQDIVHTCLTSNIKLFVNYIRRSDLGVVEIKKRIETGLLGTKFKGIVWYSKGLIHNGSHFINLIEYWFGELIESTLVDKGRIVNDLDSEPTLYLKYKNADFVVIPAWDEDFSHLSIELISDLGRLSYNKGGELIQWQPAKIQSLLSTHKKLSEENEKIESSMDKYQWCVTNELSKFFKGEEYNLCNGEGALLTLVNLNNIIKNSKWEKKN